MKRSTVLEALFVATPVAVIVVACAASPADEAQAPIVVSTEEEPAEVATTDAGAARQVALEQARNAGILGLLGDMGDAGSSFASIFGTSGLDGGDLETALGGLVGDEIGEAFGAGGLGLSGVGRGGGGTGEVIGLGSIGTIGQGAGTGSGAGYGSGSGRLGGAGSKAPPRLNPGAAAVQGGLPKEVIQRVVRRHLAQMRYCYEQGLTRDPTLEGRVTARFVIAKGGSVASVQVSGDLPDTAVHDCVRRVYERMVFPPPDPAGVVVVSYPLLFSPGEPDAAAPPAPSAPPPAGSSAPNAP